MEVMIVGAGGLVGKALARRFSKDHQVLSLTHSDLDITDAAAVRRVIFDRQPEVIINCAVLGTEACEAEPALARAVNVTGAENLAKTAAEIYADLVQISTNYVFDGKIQNGSFYTLNDAPNPINVYGQTKLAGERSVKAASDRCFIVRTSWIFGIGKENFFSSLPRSLNTGKKIRAITDVWASATYVEDLISRVTEILARRRYGTYHVVNGGLCSYYNFALEVARILKISDSELRDLIEPVKLSQLRSAAAQRPSYTPLRCLLSEDSGLEKLRDWREALAAYIRDECPLNQ